MICNVIDQKWQNLVLITCCISQLQNALLYIPVKVTSLRLYSSFSVVKGQKRDYCFFCIVLLGLLLGLFKKYRTAVGRNQPTNLVRGLGIMLTISCELVILLCNPVMDLPIRNCILEHLKWIFSPPRIPDLSRLLKLSIISKPHGIEIH